MSIKVILVPISGHENDEKTLDIAGIIAKRFTSHIKTIHVMMDARDAVPFVGQGLSAHVVEQIIRSVEAEADSAQTAARTTYLSWIKKNDIREINDGVTPEIQKGIDKTATISWHGEIGRANDIIPQVGRLADLIVFPHPDAQTDDDNQAVVEAVLFETGRPLLFVPDKINPDFGKHIAIFWNGSEECARALESTMPFFPFAKKVTLITAKDADTMGESVERAVDYLGWHHVHAEAINIECARDEIGESLVEKAKEIGADFIAMGAYSHSKLRQIILGSITKRVLQETSIPTLFVR